MPLRRRSFGIVALGVAVVVAGLIVLYLFTLHDHVHMAYISYVAECVPDGRAIIEEKGYEIAGETVVTYQDGEIVDINVSVVPDASPKTRVHEDCHVAQALRGGLYSCEQPLGRWLNEFECYWKSD